MIIEKLTEKIISERVEKDFCFRASSCGSCSRSLAYQRLGFKGEPIGARGLLTFKHGDLVEQTLLSYSVGIYDTQREVRIIDGDLEISGHIDGLYNWVYDGGAETVVIDFKSINTRGFARAEKGECDNKYKVQMNLYMYALNLQKAVLIYFNKDTSHLCEVIVYRDDELIKTTLKRMHEVKNATIDTLPDREYNIDDKATGWICGYCAYTLLCYPDRELVIEKGKPKYNKTEKSAGEGK